MNVAERHGVGVVVLRRRARAAAPARRCGRTASCERNQHATANTIARAMYALQRTAVERRSARRLTTWRSPVGARGRRGGPAEATADRETRGRRGSPAGRARARRRPATPCGGRGRGCGDCATRRAASPGRGSPHESRSGCSGVRAHDRPRAAVPRRRARGASAMRITVDARRAGASAARTGASMAMKCGSRRAGCACPAHVREHHRDVGQHIAPRPNTQVYQPYGVIATIRMKHAMRMPIVMRYLVKRAPRLLVRCARHRRRGLGLRGGSSRCFQRTPRGAARPGARSSETRRR